MTANISSRATFFHALALVLGFSLVFTLLGASVGLLGSRVLYGWLPAIARIGSVLLIVFALRIMHIRLSYIGWAVAAGVLALVTYFLQGWRFVEPSARIMNAALVGIVTLAAAPWDRMVLLALALLASVLNLFGSGSLELWQRAVESVLIAPIIFFGYRTNVFEQEFRMDMGGRLGGVSYGRSLMVGVIFAAGWTPCVGPILSGILILASQAQTVWQGALLLGVYSLGLGIPFLIAGLMFSRLTRYLPRLNKHMPTISLISAGLLLFIALLIFNGNLAWFAQFGSFLSFEQNLTINSVSEISLALAFLAGLLSFLSPCVLPLVPAYLGYLSGAAIGNAVASRESAQPTTA